MCGAAWPCLHTFLSLLYLTTCIEVTICLMTLDIKRLSVTKGRSLFSWAPLVLTHKCRSVWKRRALWENPPVWGSTCSFLLPSGVVAQCDLGRNNLASLIGTGFWRSREPWFLCPRSRSHHLGALTTQDCLQDLSVSSSNTSTRVRGDSASLVLLLLARPELPLLCLPVCFPFQGSMHTVSLYSCGVSIWPW